MNSIKAITALVLSLMILTACGKKAEPESTTTTSLTAGSSIAFSNRTSSSVTVTWGAGTSSGTATANLQYKMVYSTSNNVSTVATAEANGTLALDWSTNILTYDLTVLPASTTYYVAVLIKDNANNEVIMTASTSTLCAGKIIFITAVTDGNMGGKAGADGICNVHKPTGFGGSTFKAMLGDANGPARAACYVSGNDNCSSSVAGRMDWLFTMAQPLCTSDYSKQIGTTDGFSLLVATTANAITSSATKVFTGFNIAWGISTSNNCADWSTTGGANAVAGLANSTGNGFFAGTSLSCASAGSIYCVEQ